MAATGSGRPDRVTTPMERRITGAASGRATRPSACPNACTVRLSVDCPTPAATAPRLKLPAAAT
nr:hypothetical protein [Lichenicoccus roseus]